MMNLAFFLLAELEYLYIVLGSMGKVYQYKQESDKPLPSPLQ